LNGTSGEKKGKLREAKNVRDELRDRMGRNELLQAVTWAGRTGVRA